MNELDNITILKNVVFTLDDIEIKGEKAAKAYLGCFNALRTVISRLELEKSKGSDE